MDRIDRGIVAALAEGARMSLKQLADAVALSAPAVAERVKRLEERGVIRGYTVVIDPRALGYAIQAIVRINPVPGALREVEAMIQDTPAFVECDRVTGEDCFIGRLHVRSIDELDAVLDRFHDRAQTNTAIVKSQPVARRLPALLPSGDH